ncbi:hypothetical protein EDC04DRAFT_2558903 [Pisolithus marmoratus]|nr:hypothetical protein EDC04DRAFT_2558903 [Pisolithus marmoratus]
MQQAQCLRPRSHHLRPQESVRLRNMDDTYSQIVLPFTSSPELFEQYTNTSGRFRTGAMLMDCRAP